VLAPVADHAIACADVNSHERVSPWTSKFIPRSVDHHLRNIVGVQSILLTSAHGPSTVISTLIYLPEGHSTSHQATMCHGDLPEQQ